MLMKLVTNNGLKSRINGMLMKLVTINGMKITDKWDVDEIGYN
jgi:hypothetical protein